MGNRYNQEMIKNRYNRFEVVIMTERDEVEKNIIQSE